MKIKIRLFIPFVLLVVAVLLVRCKSCDCGFQPPKAKKNTTWVKR